MDARETKIYLALLIAVITVGSVLVFFLLTTVRLHRRYRRLHKSKSEAQILVQEKERTRIAADLHDELGPILSAAKFKITEVEPPSPEEQQLLHEAADHINNIIGRIRQISNGLMPNTLLRKGPVYAIGEFIHSVTASFPISIEFLHVNIPALSQQQDINIYRILQEVIHNTIKHAKAQRLCIRLYLRSRLLVMDCADDGIGFNEVQVTNEKTGLGLQNILLRTEMLGGAMFLYTNPGKGTQIIFEIPLEHSIKNNNENNTGD